MKKSWKREMTSIDEIKLDAFSYLVGFTIGILLVLTFSIIYNIRADKSHRAEMIKIKNEMSAQTQTINTRDKMMDAIYKTKFCWECHK